MGSPYKPSPLSFNSPRTSPFRRPESPASPSPLRKSTEAAPNLPAPTSPTKVMTPSKLNSTVSTPRNDNWTARNTNGAYSPSPLRSPETSPTKGAGNKTAMLTDRFSPSKNDYFTPSPPFKAEPTTNSSPQRPAYGARAMSETNALSKLQPSQVRELREGFQILDRDDDGTVTKEDVIEMLTQLGLPSTPSTLSTFFPDKPTITMAAFLSQISTLMAALSPPNELLNAFAAFDDDDSGQVDLQELREALLQTQPERGEERLRESEVDRVLGQYSGRRAFGKTLGGKRGEVFRYREFVESVSGGGKKGEEE